MEENGLGPIYSRNGRTLTMNIAEVKAVETRTEARTFLDMYRSVEFSISPRDPVLQFRIRDVSPSGMGILMNKASKALAYLRVGQLIDMTYNPENGKGAPEHMKTEIRHITYLENGPFKGQYLVGLHIKTRSR